jgi:hypothetical protein
LEAMQVLANVLVIFRLCTPHTSSIATSICDR